MLRASEKDLHLSTNTVATSIDIPFLYFSFRSKDKMIIARPEIAIMIVFGIMVPTGDNYSDLWLSYKFFTGNYEPAGKFYSEYER